MEEGDKLCKVALALCYCGAGFQGMQRNPGAATIEGELEAALARVGAIDPSCGGAKQLGWRRAARTDAGVSAAAQLVTGRLLRAAAAGPAGELVALVNAQLPASIRLLGAQPVPAAFCAKACCVGRSYEYLLPALAFDPAAHRGRLEGGDAGDPCFQLGDQGRRRLNQVLAGFLGRHNFHNFSWRVAADDPAAERTVLSFAAAQEEVQVGGVSLVRLLVAGRSFMLHQIRKMVGLAVAVMRGAAPAAAVATALRSEVEAAVPTAPQLGLLLDQCSYSGGGPACFSAARREMDEFKWEVIYGRIAEGSLDALARWLPSLNARNYPLFNTS